jgi:L-iditol 2-dehydrogenase
MNHKIMLQDAGSAVYVRDESEADHCLIDVKACGICVTDRKCFVSPPASQNLPVVPGHEFGGIYRPTGEEVIVWPALSCGQCSQCLAGRINLCSAIQLFGLHLDGGFQSCFSLPEEQLSRFLYLPKPANISWSQACLAEPLGCVIHSLGMLSQVPARLTVYGAGLMGRLAVRLAAHLWPECQIEVIEPEPARQIAAGQIASTDRPDVIFLACSGSEAVQQAIGRIMAGGHILLFSGLNRQCMPLAVDYNHLHRREIHLHGSYGCLPEDMAQGLEILAAQVIEVDDLITKIIPLADGVAELASPADPQQFKTVLIMD